MNSKRLPVVNSLYMLGGRSAVFFSLLILLCFEQIRLLESFCTQKFQSVFCSLMGSIGFLDAAPVTRRWEM